jgi:hypothetical protein
MFKKQVNKYYGTKQVASARKVVESRSHDRRDDHREYRNSRSSSTHHHSPGNLTRRKHARSGLDSSPSASTIKNQRRSFESDIC